jgi:hypothetical protein
MIVFKEAAQYRLNNPRQVFQEQLKISEDHQYTKIRT